jgi:hypothetical protein
MHKSYSQISQLRAAALSRLAKRHFSHGNLSTIFAAGSMRIPITIIQKRPNIFRA